MATSYSTLVQGTNPVSIVSPINTLADSSKLPAPLLVGTLARAWCTAVDHFLADNVLTQEEENRLTAFANAFGLAQAQLDASGAWSRVTKSAVLRDVFEGKIPQRVQLSGTLAFNFQKSEALVWLFNAVRYLEERTRRTYVGGYSGVSIRVMQGVYYRTGSFRGRPVETSSLESIDAGQLAVTNKHPYFGGTRKSFRVPLAKIVSFTSYSDGIGIFRDGANAKPQVFVTGDGWFTCNLIQNLANLQS